MEDLGDAIAKEKEDTQRNKNESKRAEGEQAAANKLNFVLTWVCNAI